MKALIYLTRRSFINRARQAAGKPVTYLYLVLIILYTIGVLSGIGSLAMAGGIADRRGIVYIMTVWIYFQFCVNFLSYAKLKGVIFRPAHAHFVFTAPLSSKLVLLHAAIFNYAVSLLANLLFAAAAVFVFHTGILRGILLFVLGFLLETVLETSLMVFLYCREERLQGLIRLLRFLIFALVGGVLATVFFYLLHSGFTKESVLAFFESPALKLFPGAGWETAAVTLVVEGPDRWNVTGTVLYGFLCLGLFLVAYKIRCTGAYYEDAAKFADDYARIRKKKQKGEQTLSFGTRKSRKISKTRWGTGAKAIFSRQLLEYKKERFFIFTGLTLASLIGTVVCIFFIGRPEEIPPEYAMLGIILYMVFVFSGYMGKWGKELELPYIYLIPEKPAKKLWYATCIEHVKAGIDVLIFAVPVGIFWGLSVFQIVSIIFTYIILMANRLYIKVLGESLLGETLGATGKQFFLMGVQGGIFGLGALLAVPAAIFVHENLLFLIVPVYSMMITGCIAALAVPRFACMEQWE